MKKAILIVLSTVALLATADVALAKDRSVKHHSCPKITHYFSWFTTYSDVCAFDEDDANWIRGSRDNRLPVRMKPSPV
jgi:hypothetical protein